MLSRLLLISWVIGVAQCIASDPFPTYSSTNRVLWDGGGYWADTFEWARFNSGQTITIYDSADTPQPQYVEPGGFASANLQNVFSSSTVKVAIIDTGFDLLHPDTVGRYLPGVIIENGIIVSGNYVGSHGTQGAGIIGAIGGNGVGISGVLKDGAKMSPISVSGRSMADYAVAVDYAVTSGCKVIYFPHGWNYEPLDLKAAFTRARAGGTLIVCSAVQGLPTPLVDYPALWVPELENIILVGGHDMAGAHWPDSGWQHNGYIHFLAPGRRVVTLWPGGDLRYTSGTSSAGAFGAGVAALLWEKRPSFDFNQVKSALIATRNGERMDATAALLWTPSNVTVKMIGERAETVNGPWVKIFDQGTNTGGETNAFFRARLEIVR